MRIVIVGAGVVGYHTASLLSGEDHDIVIIDNDEVALGQARDQLDVMTYSGSGSNPHILREAGTANADLFVAATAIDEVNMVACFLAKQLGARRTVARVRDTSALSPMIVGSAKDHKRVVRGKTMGVDFAITPEQVTAEEIGRVMRRTSAIAVEEFGEGRIELSEFRLSKPVEDGRPLKDIDFPRPCIVAAIIRQGKTILPHGDDSLLAGDLVFVVGARESMGALVRVFGATESVMRSGVILGGGRIGLRTAHLLTGMGMRIKIIEKDLEKARGLAESLEGILVIHGAGTDAAFLREEGVADADGFVSTTGRDELNILVGLLAKSVGVKRVVITVNKPEYISLVEELGIDAAVNPLTMTANAILRFVRRGQIISVARIAGDTAEAIEFVVPEEYRQAGQTLREATLPKDVLIGAVVRKDRVLIPDGNTTIEVDDKVVAITRPAIIPTLERYFGLK